MTGKKITGRTKQLSLKATAEFHQRLRTLASKKKCLMIEILEQAMELYERKRTIKENIQPISRNKITKSNKRSRDDEQEEQPNTSFKKRKFNS